MQSQEKGQKQQKSDSRQRGEKDQTTGQDQREQAQPQQGQNEQGKREQGQRGQGQRDQGQANERNQQTPDRREPGQAQKNPSQTAPSGTQTQTQPGRDGERQGQSQPGQQSQQPQQAARDDNSVNLSVEQRTRIRTTVLAGNNVPRVNNVNFSIRVGTVVPTSVRVVEVPATLIEIYPQWRGHHYFVVQEEIIIVDRDHRIVSVVAVGSGSGAQLDNRGDDRAVGVSMSSDEIRQVQIILKQKGYAVDVDGVLGPRTRQAIIVFQRQQGFQATGQIDQRTSVALGIGSGNRNESGNRNDSAGDRNRTDQQPTANQQGNQPTSTGQSDGDGSRQSPSAPPSQNPARDNSRGPDGTSNNPPAGMGNKPSDGTRNQPAAK